MGQAGLDKYQLAGLDSRERGFSRPVEFERTGEGYRAILRYETIRVVTDQQATQDEALYGLIQTLQADGYRQLRTQMSFRKDLYLGSQELWVEYPDLQPVPQPQGLIAKIVSWLRPRATNRYSL